MIERALQSQVLELASRYPVLTLTGPRQSGKTTLSKMAFPKKAYVTLENPANREFATDDPIGFLGQYGDGAIFDEVQRTPELPSYLQSLVDDDPSPGRFVLTGSQNLALMSSVSQSLAGRTALVELLPLDLSEMRRFPKLADDIESHVWTGGYPRIHDRDLPADEWLADYVTTYVERDVRQILRVGDLLQFQTFLRLCAGRTGQLLNLSSLANDAGISSPTARSWLSVLETSYIAFRIPQLHANFNKRLVKSPKLYFYDAGLASNLLGIEQPGQLLTHPLRGALFETWVIAEIFKQQVHRGRKPRLYTYQERGRLEIDLLIDHAGQLTLIEIKSGKTPSSRFFSAQEQFVDRLAANASGPWRLGHRFVVYGGDETQERSQGTLLSWRDLDRVDWAFPSTEA
ncbi:MAG: ATP-binding protein [Acidobacteriota bacterium]